MNELYEKMLSAYDQSTDTARRNAVYEVSQQIVLAGLAVPVFVSFMGLTDSVKIWISRCSKKITHFTLSNTFSQSSTSSPW